MKKTLLFLASAGLLIMASLASAAPAVGYYGRPYGGVASYSRPVVVGGGYYARPAGVYYGYPARYPGWYGSYWGGWGVGWGLGLGLGVGLAYGYPYNYGYPYRYGYPYNYGYAYSSCYPYGYDYAYPNGNPCIGAVPGVVITQPATTFIQQDQVAPAPASSYWYYCTDPAGYFPYVQSCNRAWMAVIPQVPSDLPTAPRLAQ